MSQMFCLQEFIPVKFHAVSLSHPAHDDNWQTISYVLFYQLLVLSTFFPLTPLLILAETLLLNLKSGTFTNLCDRIFLNLRGNQKSWVLKLLSSAKAKFWFSVVNKLLKTVTAYFVTVNQTTNWADEVCWKFVLMYPCSHTLGARFLSFFGIS